ncbi:hypothetical protein [Martelella soudanensis]|uniref:hypothetical protein n=1 Tax=unclassified Martelella TaxID=2629616 RepID=UPI0015E02655|nr:MULTISPECIES: hypothetical protein [unclassified Martelella]
MSDVPFSEWFTSLDTSLQVAFIGAAALVLNGVVSATITLAGLAIGARNARRSNKVILQSAEVSFRRQSHHTNAVEIAKMRQAWLDDLRLHMANFSQKTANLMMSIKSSVPYKESAQFEFNYIHLKLTDNGERATEIRNIMHDMTELSNNCIANRESIDLEDSHEKFQDLHSRFIVVSNLFMKDEWKKIKQELRYSEVSEDL